jgi:hypothetical protein
MPGIKDSGLVVHQDHRSASHADKGVTVTGLGGRLAAGGERYPDI